MENKKLNKKAILGVVALVALIAIFAIVFTVFKPKTMEGSKTITFEVVNKAGESTEYEVKTDAEYLRQAMEEAMEAEIGFTFAGDETQYGLTLHTVNGEKADFNTDSAYWSILVNGEYGQYGAESQPVVDGDTYSFVYTMYTAQ